MGERGFVPAMVVMPYLSPTPVDLVLVVVHLHRAPFASNCIGAHSPGAIAFRPVGALGTKRTTGFQPYYAKYFNVQYRIMNNQYPIHLTNDKFPFAPLRLCGDVFFIPLGARGLCPGLGWERQLQRTARRSPKNYKIATFDINIIEL